MLFLVGFCSGLVQVVIDDRWMDSYLVAVRDVCAEEESMCCVFSEVVLVYAGSGLSYVIFINGGVEVVEKVFYLVRWNGLGGRCVIVFEGSFYGCTFLVFFFIWNFVK